MRKGFFYYRRRMDRGTMVRVAVFFLAAMMIAFFLNGMARMRPLLESLATTRVSNTVNRIIVEAVNEAIRDGDVGYEELISLEKDNDGKITAILHALTS